MAFKYPFRLLIMSIAFTATLLSGTASALQSLTTSPGDIPALNKQAIPVINFNQQAGIPAARVPHEEALTAISEFTAAHPGAVVRWHDFSGSPDVIYGFASEPVSGDAVTAARNFLFGHSGLFGVVDGASLVLDQRKTRPAFGGHLVRFDQVYAGVPVRHAGFGLVLDEANRVIAVSGPFYDNLDVNTTPSLGATQAVNTAARDLTQFQSVIPGDGMEALAPAFEAIEAELGILTTPHPELTIYPTANGARLAWEFFYYSRNPFGMFRYIVDAHSGQILYRENFVRTQEQQPLPFTADYFPTSPPITEALQDEGLILDESGGTSGRPAGQVRIELRKFDASNAVTGAHGTLTGDHALIRNALPTQQPFLQAAAGTWHFATDNLPLEGRTNERDQLAEPAEHQDGISQFIYITSLIEYLDYLHREGDAAHNRGLGQGDFPNSYPNDDTPLVGIVHVPNVSDLICGSYGDPTQPEEFLRRLMACDNAFAIPVSTEVAGQPVVVNPTAYGHGYLFNDLAIDFAVPLHEGTHATITPIAGFEGAPEGGALNEGQADLWAYTVGENPSLGAYIVNAFRLRDLLAANGVDPDTFQWIRNANSQIRYSQLGTRDNSFEVHRDGEIYAGALWDVRQLMLQYETGGPFVRPDQITGEPSNAIPLGKETWERIFLGSMYILGTMAPDTFVRARDAFLIADAVLYPVNPVDPATSGRHRALIEQVFAARELGINAAPPDAGRHTISTAVSQFTANQPKPPAPQNVVAVPSSTDSIEISWEPVAGAFAYEVLKRRSDSDSRRLFEGVPGREYFDGDQAEGLSGFTHIEFVYGAGTTQYTDAGQALGRHGPLGLDSLSYDYVVRAIAVNENGQVAFSALSGTAPVALGVFDVSAAMDSDILNASFESGVFSFDMTLTNQSGAGEFDGTVYTPITFKIIDISEDSVTVANADNGGSGQNGDEAHFGFEPALAVDETSEARQLRFNDPDAKLFTFDALVTARVEVAPVPATGSQPADGYIDPAPRPEPNPRFVEEFTGVVPIGSAGAQLAEGVDYVDVPFTTQPSAISVTGTLSASPSAPPYPDLDFQLRDAEGNVLTNSASFGPNEQVGFPVDGSTKYVYRVVGFANGPTLFKIVSEQEVTDPQDAGTGDSGGATTGSVTQWVRFTVNPLTESVSVSVLQ